MQLLALSSLLLLSLQHVQPALACPHIDERAMGADSSSSSPLTIGTDGPQDPATIGYKLNHLALIVSNITTTKNFYGTVLGMRTLFDFVVSDTYSITYMGYARGGLNGTGFQTGAELYAQKTNIEGLIEFLYVTDPVKDLQASSILPNTFSHVGLVVPDIQATAARMKEYGVKIVKPLGKSVAPKSGVARAYGLGEHPREDQATLRGIELIGFEYFLLVQDPDGNLVEIQQQV